MESSTSPVEAPAVPVAIDDETRAVLLRMMQKQQDTYQRIAQINDTLLEMARNQAQNSKADRSVLVHDVNMSMAAMIGFMVKWAIASVPAFLILAACGWFALIAFGTFLAALLARSQ